LLPVRLPFNVVVSLRLFRQPLLLAAVVTLRGTPFWNGPVGDGFEESSVEAFASFYGQASA
jgi:hypothetical protein